LTVTAAETINYHAASATVTLDVLKAYSLAGYVYIDLNNDGELDLGESGVEGVTITLTGEDDLGAAVLITTTTDDEGFYQFGGLRPGLYRITESQPSGFLQGTNRTGTLGNVSLGSLSEDAIDQFFIDLSGEVIDPSTDTDAINFNFGEIPQSTGGIQTGETAGIGFWQNKNGQNLIKSLNSGPTSTALGNWLSTNFPNMYGMLAGKTNAQVASHYKHLFALNGKSAPSGPPKLDAQVLATALAVYVTNHSLAGDTAAAYGFRVTAFGVGAATISVGTSGAAFGLADHSTVSVFELLFATDSMTVNGILYSHSNATLMKSLRDMANEVYSLINDDE